MNTMDNVIARVPLLPRYILAALVLCDVGSVDYSYINGRCVVEEGRLTTAELPRLIETVNRLSTAMVQA